MVKKQYGQTIGKGPPCGFSKKNFRLHTHKCTNKVTLLKTNFSSFGQKEARFSLQKNLTAVLEGKSLNKTKKFIRSVPIKWPFWICDMYGFG